MSPAEEELASKLSIEFGLSFRVALESSPKGFAVSACPHSDVHDQIAIKAEVVHGVRLRVKAVPEDFSRPFVDTMALADTQKKAEALSELEKLDKRVQKLSFRADGVDLTKLSPEDWPTQWPKFEYSFTVFPLSDREEGEIVHEVCDWVLAAFRPIFALLELTVEGLPNGFEEGDAKRVELNRYERDARNRQLCILAKGVSCSVCGFNFEEIYGELGRGFIHVHHIVPVSMLGPHYKINPLEDLIPVCPNCHAMLHRKNPPLTPEELRGIVKGGS